MTSDDVVNAARAWLGTPYRHRAAVRRAGCDCLGLLRGVWRTLYGAEPMAVPNYRADMRDGAHAGELMAAAEMVLLRASGELSAGQVVLFRLRRAMAAKHCGIMVSATRFIHAQERLGVVEANMTDGWRGRIAATFAFPGIED